MPRHTGPIAAVLFLMVSLLPITPASGYIDSQRAYEMALAHHYPTNGRVRNYRIAMLLYCRADTDRHAESAYAIGLLFAGGHGFKQDQTRAHAWFKRAAALGHPEAKSMAALFKPRGKRSTARCPNGWALPRGPVCMRQRKSVRSSTKWHWNSSSTRNWCWRLSRSNPLISRTRYRPPMRRG